MGNCMKSTQRDYKQKQREEYAKYNQPTEQDLAIARLKDIRDELYSKQQALYKQEEKSEKEIKQLLREKKKERAKFTMQRKKLYDNYLTQIEQKYQFIQGQIVQVEKMIMDKNLNEVMESTNNFLKDIQKAINMDVFDEAKEANTMLEEQEQQFDQLFQQYNVGCDVDQELEKYEAEVFQNQINNAAINGNQRQFHEIQCQEQMEIEQVPIKKLSQQQMLVN